MEVVRPVSLDEALEVKARHPHAVPVAGGTDLMVDLARGRARPDLMLDLSRVAQLRELDRADGMLLLGAGVTYSRMIAELAPFVALVQAARTVGSLQIRNRGTVGGNLATASPAGDTLPVLAAYGAEVVLACADGGRTVPLGQFLTGPKRTALRPDELITAVRWPVTRHTGTFAKIGPRAAMVIAVASLAVVVDHDRRVVRAALGAVGPTVLRAAEAEQYAAGLLTDLDAWDEPAVTLPPGAAEQFGALVAAASRPIDDVRGTAAYRRHACAVLGARALRRLCLPAQAAA